MVLVVQFGGVFGDVAVVRRAQSVVEEHPGTVAAVRRRRTRLERRQTAATVCGNRRTRKRTFGVVVVVVNATCADVTTLCCRRPSTRADVIGLCLLGAFARADVITWCGAADDVIVSCEIVKQKAARQMSSPV